MPLTQKDHNRAIRQEALREQLSKQKHVEHVVEIIKKIGDANTLVEKDMLDRYKIVIDTKLKLINKYCPDLRATEVTGEAGATLMPVQTLTKEEMDAFSKKLDEEC